MASLRMARRFTRGGATRLALTVLAVAWGVALVAAVRLANHAVLRAFVEVIDTMAGRAALEVVAGEGGLFPEDVAAAVGATPGVEVAVPCVKGAAFAEGGALLTVYGVDLTGDAAERVYGAQLEVDDPLAFLARPDSIAVARSFAEKRGLSPGDRLELTTPAGRRAFTVRGLLDAGGVARAYAGNVAVMDLHAAEQLFTRRGFITGVDVVVAPEADVRRVAEAIARRLPAGLRVEATAERQADLRRVTESLRTALQALGLFGLVAAFLITFNRLSTVFEERAWQLGVLRAVGVRTSAVWRSLVGESLLVGTAGVALGIPLGIGLGRLLVPVIATASAVADKLVAPPAALAAEPGPLLLAGVLGLVTAVLAAALPAWRVARVAAAETMRSRGHEAPGASARVVWVLRGVALAAAGGSLVALARHPSARSGLLATAVVAVGTALAARPAVHGAGFLLGVGARRVAGPVGRFGAASFLHNPRRTALTVATLGVGLGCVVWFWTMAESFRSSLVVALTAAVRADLVVTSVHVTNGYVEAPVSEELARRLAAVPGVAVAIASRVIDWPHGGRRVGELPLELRGAGRRAGGARHAERPARPRDRRRDGRLRVARRDDPHEPRGVRPLLAGWSSEPRGPAGGARGRRGRRARGNHAGPGSGVRSPHPEHGRADRVLCGAGRPCLRAARGARRDGAPGDAPRRRRHAPRRRDRAHARARDGARRGHPAETARVHGARRGAPAGRARRRARDGVGGRPRGAVGPADVAMSPRLGARAPPPVPGVAGARRAHGRGRRGGGHGARASGRAARARPGAAAGVGRWRTSQSLSKK